MDTTTPIAGCCNRQGTETLSFVYDHVSRKWGTRTAPFTVVDSCWSRCCSASVGETKGSVGGNNKDDLTTSRGLMVPETDCFVHTLWNQKEQASSEWRRWEALYIRDKQAHRRVPREKKKTLWAIAHPCQRWENTHSGSQYSFWIESPLWHGSLPYEVVTANNVICIISLVLHNCIYWCSIVSNGLYLKAMFLVAPFCNDLHKCQNWVNGNGKICIFSRKGHQSLLFMS